MLIPYKLKENSLKIVKIIQLKEGFKLNRSTENVLIK